MPSAVGRIYYARHFALLAGAAAALVASCRGGLRLPGVAALGLYGALYSSIVVGTLRAAQPLSRKLEFIAGGACLSMLSATLIYYGSGFIGGLPDGAGPLLLLALSSGLGAATYAMLVRLLWMHDLSLRALVTITLGCVLATFVVYTSRIYLLAGGVAAFAVFWWCAFSLGLWYHDRREMH